MMRTFRVGRHYADDQSPRSSVSSRAPASLESRAEVARVQRLSLLGGLAILLVATPAIRPSPVRLIWNASPSVPIGLYRIDNYERARVGELVAVRPAPPLARFMAERRYVEMGVLLIKPIAAAEGSLVCRNGLDLWIDGRLAARALPADRLARALPRWAGCRRLGGDQLLLLANARPDSFDSRYFGQVTRSAIVGRATPLWTWR